MLSLDINVITGSGSVYPVVSDIAIANIIAITSANFVLSLFPGVKTFHSNSHSIISVTVNLSIRSSITSILRSHFLLIISLDAISSLLSFLESIHFFLFLYNLGLYGLDLICFFSHI